MECVRPITIKNPCLTSEEVNVYNTGLIDRKRISVPCGKCYACKVNYQRQWVFRMLAHMDTSEYPAIFFTLTYDDDSLPYNSLGQPTLRKPHLSAFLKRLRSGIDYHCEKNDIPEFKFQFYACGEYGSSSLRPHYHIIMFDVRPDIQDFLRSFILKHWHYSQLDPKLIVVNGPQLVFYISKYITKAMESKLNLFPEEKYKYFSGNRDTWNVARDLLDLLKDDAFQESPFAEMSRRPAIGKKYWEKLSLNDKQFFLDSPVVHIHGQAFSLPRYYRQKIFDSYERSELLEKSCLRKDKKTRSDIYKNKSEVEVKKILSEHKNSKDLLF